MKKLMLILCISFFAKTELVAQIIPLGLYVDLDGKVKFWESEANPNGNVDDTVYLTVNGESYLDDLRNLKYDHLTLVEAPKSRYTMASDEDPSRVNDPNRFDRPSSQGYFIAWDSIEPLNVPSPRKKRAKQKKNRFSDDFRGEGLTDSVIKLVKIKLNDFVTRHYGKSMPYAQLDELSHEISDYDSMIENIAIYDYILDLMVSYEYDRKGRLTKVLGYHWNYGIEVDSLTYDKSGKLICFSRERIASHRDEYFFSYDKKGRVLTVIGNSRSMYEQDQLTNTATSPIKFTYNQAGIMNSKAELIEGNWKTLYFEIK